MITGWNHLKYRNLNIHFPLCTDSAYLWRKIKGKYSLKYCLYKQEISLIVTFIQKCVFCIFSFEVLLCAFFDKGVTCNSRQWNVAWWHCHGHCIEVIHLKHHKTAYRNILSNNFLLNLSRSDHDELGRHKSRKSLIYPVHFYTKFKNR